MLFTHDEVRKIISDAEMQKLIRKFKAPKLSDINNYESLSDEGKEEISEALFELMSIGAPTRLIYPPCDEQFPNDCEVYGVRGFYIVFYPNDRIVEKFTNKKTALQEASKVSKMFHELWNLTQ